MSYTVLPPESVDDYPVDHPDQPWNNIPSFDGETAEERRNQWRERNGKSQPSETGNPKDVAARKHGKPQLSLVEPALKAGIAYAMADGVEKYGLRNYLYKPILIRTYTDALQRHIDDFVNGEEWAGDSGVHHLDHAAACLNVLMGALSYGVAIDNRFPPEMHDAHPPITTLRHHNPESSKEPGE